MKNCPYPECAFTAGTDWGVYIHVVKRQRPAANENMGHRPEMDTIACKAMNVLPLSLGGSEFSFTDVIISGEAAVSDSNVVVIMVQLV